MNRINLERLVDPLAPIRISRMGSHSGNYEVALVLNDVVIKAAKEGYDKATRPSRLPGQSQPQY